MIVPYDELVRRKLRQPSQSQTASGVAPEASLVPFPARHQAVTVERIERNIRTVARMMVKHNMPELIVTIRFLEAERDKLRQQTAAMDYAKELLAQKGRNIGSNIALPRST